jgi:hypothetical protein
LGGTNAGNGAPTNGSPTSAVPNRGGGGGGEGVNGADGNGGSGIVIVSYPRTYNAGVPPGQPKWVPLEGGFPTLALDSPVSFSGAVVPGATLTRQPAVWSRADTVVVEWLLDNVVVATDTNTYFVPDQVGSVVKLRETATGTGNVLTSEYSQAIVVGNIGTYKVTRVFIDIMYPDPNIAEIPWLSNPDAGGDSVTTPTVLVTDDWNIGLVTESPVVPKTSTYRIVAAHDYPDSWTNGSSGTLYGLKTDLLIGGVVYALEDNTSNRIRRVDINVPITAGQSVQLRYCGAAAGKAPRPNNLSLEIIDLA